MTEVHVRTMCHPTEDRAKVVGGILAIFPGADVRGEGAIEATVTSLDRFAELIARQQIRDAARSVLRRNIDGGSASFTLNKQVAAAGRISFAEEDHPLGDIQVVIVDDDIEALIDRVAPSTRPPRGQSP